MFKGKLTDKQWNQLGDIQKELHEEYKIRRKMLLTRLDVTLQSFEVLCSLLLILYRSNGEFLVAFLF